MVILAELDSSAGDLAQVRFVVSSMWQMVASFRLLSNHASASPCIPCAPPLDRAGPATGGSCPAGQGVARGADPANGLLSVRPHPRLRGALPGARRGAGHRCLPPCPSPPSRRARCGPRTRRPAHRGEMGRQHTAPDPSEQATVPRHGGPGLLLVPSAFTGPRLPTRVAPPGSPQLVYPASGIGSLWVLRPTTGADSLAAVLGRSRTAC